ncbi:hypothetical protein PR048_031250 [Dryococelus australis]|uniref:Uncharacterized protein n=1 Tax=Dryococelus australis TaxID=614101 RepID=A0ABQ9G7U7_9NEOP|nr:hypothetical protein PR048_031250 [Dryococelus australis]
MSLASRLCSDLTFPKSRLHGMKNCFAKTSSAIEEVTLPANEFRPHRPFLATKATSSPLGFTRGYPKDVLSEPTREAETLSPAYVVCQLAAVCEEVLGRRKRLVDDFPDVYESGGRGIIWRSKGRGSNCAAQEGNDTRESCQTMPLVGGFFRGSPIAFRRRSKLTSFHPHRLSGTRQSGVKCDHLSEVHLIKPMACEGAAVAQRLARSPPPPPRRSGFDPLRVRSRIFACGNSVLDDAAGFLGVIPFPAPLHPSVSLRVISGNDAHLRVPAGKPDTRRVLAHHGSTLNTTIYTTSYLSVLGPKNKETIGHLFERGFQLACSVRVIKFINVSRYIFALVREVCRKKHMSGKLGLAVLCTRPYILREYAYVDALGRLDVYFTFLAPFHSIVWGFMGITGWLLRCSFQPEVSMEQHRNAMAEETGDPRENPATSGIVRHDSHVRKTWSDAAWNRNRFTFVGGGCSIRYSTAVKALVSEKYIIVNFNELLIRSGTFVIEVASGLEANIPRTPLERTMIYPQRTRYLFPFSTSEQHEFGAGLVKLRQENEAFMRYGSRQTRAFEAVGAGSIRATLPRAVSAPSQLSAKFWLGVLCSRCTAEEGLGKESAMAFVRDPSHHSPGVISGNHGKPKSGWPDRESNTWSSRMRVHNIKTLEDQREIGTMVAGGGGGGVSLLASHRGEPGFIPGRVTPDFRMWESRRSMPLVSGFSRRSPVSPALPFQCCSTPTSITLVGSRDLDVKSRPNLFKKKFVTQSPARDFEIIRESPQPPYDLRNLILLVLPRLKFVSRVEARHLLLMFSRAGKDLSAAMVFPYLFTTKLPREINQLLRHHCLFTVIPLRGTGGGKQSRTQWPSWRPDRVGRLGWEKVGGGGRGTRVALALRRHHCSIPLNPGRSSESYARGAVNTRPSSPPPTHSVTLSHTPRYGGDQLGIYDQLTGVTTAWGKRIRLKISRSGRQLVSSTPAPDRSLKAPQTN